MLLCDVQGIAVASGTSCVSKALKISPVLAAIGLDHALAQGAVILSLGKDNTDEEMDYVLETLPKVVAKLRGMSPMWDEFERGAFDRPSAPRRTGDERLRKRCRQAKPHLISVFALCLCSFAVRFFICKARNCLTNDANPGRPLRRR